MLVKGATVIKLQVKKDIEKYYIQQECTYST